MAADNFRNPLTQDHLGYLNACLQECAQCQELIDRAIRAGLPFEDAQSTVEQHRQLALQLKREFFPGAR